MPRFLSLLFVLICLHAAAQNLDAPKYDKEPQKKQHSAVGLYAGVNNNLNMAGSYLGYNAAPAFGFSGTFGLGEYWQIEAGLGYMVSGGKNIRYGNSYYSHDTLFHYEDYFNDAGYLVIPILIKYKLSPRSYVMAGPRIAKMIEGKSTVTAWFNVNGLQSEKFQYTEPLPEGSSSIDAGINAGYEYCFTDRLQLSVIAGMGFIPLVGEKVKQNWLNTVEGSYFSAPVPGNYNRCITVRLCYNLWLY